MVLFPKYNAIDDISEKIFIHLDLKSLNACQKVNKTWFEYVNDPKMWLKKCFMDKSRWLEKMDRALTSQWTLADQHWNRLLKYLFQSESYNVLKKDVLECLKRLHRMLKRLKRKPNIPDLLPLAPTFVATSCGKLKFLKFILDNSEYIYKEENEEPESFSDSGVIQINFKEDHTKFKLWKLFAIFLAATYDQEEILRYLIEKCHIENPNNIREDYQNSPIVYAARFGNTKIVKFFMGYSCNSRQLNKAARRALEFGNYQTAWMINKMECFEHIFMRVAPYIVTSLVIALSMLIYSFYYQINDNNPFRIGSFIFVLISYIICVGVMIEFWIFHFRIN